MSKKLFVGGLPFDYSDDKLRELFSPVGKVLSAVMVQDPAQGRTRGFGFVAMSTPEETQAAIAALNGSQVGTKAIYVAEAREKTPKPGAAVHDRKKTAWDQWKPAAGRRPINEPRNAAPEAPRKPFGRGPFPYNYEDARTGTASSRNRRRGSSPYRYQDGGTSPAPFGDRKRGSSPYSRGPSPYRQGRGTGPAPFGDKKRAPFDRSARPFSDRPARAPGFRNSANKPAQKPFWNKFKKTKPQE